MSVNKDPLVIPLHCPACDKNLYATPRLRPDSSLPTLGKWLVAIGAVLSVVCYFWLAMLLREKLATREPDPWDDRYVIMHYPSTRRVGAICIIPAAIPALALGFLASRLPRVRRIRCRQCKWREDFPGNAKFENPPEPARFTAASTSPKLWPQIVDTTDSMSECRAWVLAELRSGRSADEVVRDLIQQGWQADDIEGMVDKCRKELRTSRF